MPYKFTYRPYQEAPICALNDGIKRIIWCVHRRGGKDLSILNWVICQLAEKTQTCFYVMPSYAQAKKVIWDSINNDGFRILDYFPEAIIEAKNQQEMKIRFKNGSLFQLIGSDNIDSLMGTNPAIVVFSEFALQNPAAWDYIRPILKVNKGVAIFISTPRGKNFFYDMFRMAQHNAEWWAQKLTIEDTGVLSRYEYEQEIAEGMSEELALQEYYCSFDRGVDGSYYAKLLNKMDDDERIIPLNYDPSRLVHTSCDLGWDDDNPIIFFQCVGNNVHIIDVENYRNHTLAHMKDVFMSRDYRYGVQLFPWDVEQNDGLGSGCTRKEILENLGIEVTVVPKSLIADGIESVKALMQSRLYIDSRKCKDLLKSLEFYHKEWNETKKVYDSKPCHDSSSHFADALRYLAQGLHKVDVKSGRGGYENEMKAINLYMGIE